MLKNIKRFFSKVLELYELIIVGICLTLIYIFSGIPVLFILSTLLSLFYLKVIVDFFVENRVEKIILLLILSSFRFSFVYYVYGINFEVSCALLIFEFFPFFIVICGLDSHSLKNIRNNNFDTGGELVEDYKDEQKINKLYDIALKNNKYLKKSEGEILEEIIVNELEKNDVDSMLFIPSLFFRNITYSVIYFVIVFILISTIFFRFPLILIISLIMLITFILIILIKNNNIVNYLKKEIRSRPDEDISYVVASKVSKKSYKFISYILSLFIVVISILLPLYIFRSSKVIYEKLDDSYVIRFYINGWRENEKILEIPSEYKGKPVVGIRGDVFKDVKNLEEIILPETITEIRGGAFKNAKNLKTINLPSGITEIKGNTFEGCVSLEEITIPDNVTRIGGHAFRNNYSLQKVNISKDSQLKEIGSSAFRECSKLSKIYLPYGVIVNEKAFKYSPTQIKEYNIDGFVLDEDFKNKSINGLKVGELETIDDSEDSKVRGATIILIGITGNEYDYEYKFKYSYGEEEVIFVLNKNIKTKMINDNIYVEMSESYFKYYYEKIFLDIYTN